MEIDDFLDCEFIKAGLLAEEIRIIESKPASFGDFVATVRAGNKLIHVTRDRGQTFIRVFALDVGKYMRVESLLDEIYASGSWNLSDLLIAIRDSPS